MQEQVKVFLFAAVLFGTRPQGYASSNAVTRSMPLVISSSRPEAVSTEEQITTTTSPSTFVNNISYSSNPTDVWLVPAVVAMALTAILAAIAATVVVLWWRKRRNTRQSITPSAALHNARPPRTLPQFARTGDNYLSFNEINLPSIQVTPRSHQEEVRPISATTDDGDYIDLGQSPSIKERKYENQPTNDTVYYENAVFSSNQVKTNFNVPQKIQHEIVTEARKTRSSRFEAAETELDGTSNSDYETMSPTHVADSLSQKATKEIDQKATEEFKQKARKYLNQDATEEIEQSVARQFEQEAANEFKLKAVKKIKQTAEKPSEQKSTEVKREASDELEAKTRKKSKQQDGIPSQQEEIEGIERKAAEGFERGSAKHFEQKAAEESVQPSARGYNDISEAPVRPPKLLPPGYRHMNHPDYDAWM